MKKKLPVRWSPKAELRLDGIYDHIAEESVSAARYVKKAIIQLGGYLGSLSGKILQRRIPGKSAGQLPVSILPKY